MSRHFSPPVPGEIAFVGAGPGDPELLTVAALRALATAEVVLHDRLVAPAILSLAGPGATLLDTGKRGFGHAMAQERINALLVAQAHAGRFVVRLKGGDPMLFGRLDEEISAVEAAGLAWRVVPGITAASAAAAAIGQSLTQRGRNASLRVLTGHDMNGFADHDWRALARPGAVAAIYMGKAAGRFLQGRLMMHGAHPATPVSVIENASLPNQRILASRLDRLGADLAGADLSGPALILFGLAPRAAGAALPHLQGEEPLPHAL